MKINGTPAPRTSPSADAGSSPIDAFVDELAARGYEPQQIGPNQFRAKCCGHDGRHLNLSIGVGDDGRVLLRCHSKNCSEATIASGLGWDVKRLFPPQAKPLRGRRAGPSGQSQPRREEPSDVDPDVLHLVYSAMFRELQAELDEHWVTDFARMRRVPESVIKRLRDECGYGYSPDNFAAKKRIASAIRDACPDVDLLSVPGFREHDGETILSERRGLAAPIRDRDGRIVSLQVRRIDEEQIAFAKWKTPRGSHPKLHFPIVGTPGETLRVTEGVIKSDISTAYTGIYTVATIGINAAVAIEAIRELSPRRVLVALDMEYTSNPDIARVAARIVAACREFDIEVGIETWNQDAKGIDDALVDE